MRSGEWVRSFSIMFFAARILSGSMTILPSVFESPTCDSSEESATRADVLRQNTTSPLPRANIW